jgi:hypothetical protein
MDIVNTLNSNRAIPDLYSLTTNAWFVESCIKDILKKATIDSGDINLKTHPNLPFTQADKGRQ